MYKRVLLAMAAATTMLAVLPMTAASAATPVLTTGSVGGAAVNKGDIIKANLKANTKATFFSPGTTTGVSCSKASVTNKVVANPAKPGIAVESLTGQTFISTSCTTNGLGGATVKQVVVQNLPYTTKINDAAGFPVIVSKPGNVLKTSITIAFGTTPVTCIYTKALLNGNASNVGNTNTFKNQVFTRAPGSPNLCLAKGSFSATFGPLLDFSQGTTTHPKVFVN